jgi:DNA polymerase III subunit epsilon
VLAAHNVRFDHGFLKTEFKRLGINLQQKVLCTVKLSRLLYPQHFSHGIDAIVARHNIVGIARHRAMGDVEAVLRMLDDARHELGEAAVASAAQKLMAAPVLPAHVDAGLIGELPETPGVYLFYGENDTPLFIGKAANVRARVLAHFSGSKATAREQRLAQEIRRFEWIPAAGDLSALLLETRLLKQHKPLYNRQLTRERQLFSWRLDPLALPQVSLLAASDIDPSQMGRLFGTFKTRQQATEALRKIAERSQLCFKLLGLEGGADGPCVAFELKRCKGACCGLESASMHSLRLQQALVAHKLSLWPYPGKIGIEEYNLENDLRQIHVFEHWVYVGVADNEDDLQALRAQTTTLSFELETYKLLLKVLPQKKTRVHQLAP